MTIEYMVDLEINLRNIEYALWNEKPMFDVWMSIKRARERLHDHIIRDLPQQD
jgi:hypothetical protein